MKGHYHREYSRILERDLSFLVIGHGGKPVLIFPTQCGRCTDFNDFHMFDAIAKQIELGDVQLFCVDSIDRETWSHPSGDNGSRSWMLEQWFRHITEEFLPRMLEINATMQAPITAGCSLGAVHALNIFLRRPDLFDGVIALSGIYDGHHYFENYMDKYVYENSILDYMKNFPKDHSYIPMYNARNICICTGQGAWEDASVQSASALKDIFEQKGIRANIDFWGKDVDHDWIWWRKQFPYFLNKILY